MYCCELRQVGFRKRGECVRYARANGIAYSIGIDRLRIRAKKSWPQPALIASNVCYLRDSTYSSADLSSASLIVTLMGWPGGPALSTLVSSASAFLLPLNLAATSLYAGPTFFLSMS